MKCEMIILVKVPNDRTRPVSFKPPTQLTQNLTLLDFLFWVTEQNEAFKRTNERARETYREELGIGGVGG